MITGDPAGPVLQLQQVDAASADDEEIDLVLPAAAGGEGEVAPRPVGVVVVEPGPDRGEAASFMGVLGGCDLNPAPAAGLHLPLRSSAESLAPGQTFSLRSFLHPRERGQSLLDSLDFALTRQEVRIGDSLWPDYWNGRSLFLDLLTQPVRPASVSRRKEENRTRCPLGTTEKETDGVGVGRIIRMRPHGAVNLTIIVISHDTESAKPFSEEVVPYWVDHKFWYVLGGGGRSIFGGRMLGVWREKVVERRSRRRSSPFGCWSRTCHWLGWPRCWRWAESRCFGGNAR